MIDTPNQPEPSREARLDRLIAQYLQGEEAGRPINPRELLQQSPELQADFYSFLKQHEELAPTLPNAPLKFGLAETMPRGVQQGQVLGDCHLVRELGRGGMGVVYLGRHVRLDALRAVKVLPRENVSDDAIARFWREAQTAAKIDHLNVVAVHDVGRQGDVHYIVMQYINGETLAQVLDRHAAQSDGAPFPWQTALRLAHPVLDALATMHAQGLIHRDIKPSNIMATEKSSVTKRKHVVVMDFGLVRDDSEARLTATGGVVGTPAYMSPEQARGLTVDARTDVYAVGATLYSLLAGRPPFDGQRGVVFRQLVSGKRPLPLGSLRPDLPESVCKLVERAMAPELGERFSRAGEMLKDIEDLLRKAPKADARRPHPTPSFPASSAPSAPARGAPVASPAHQDTVSGAGDTGEDLASFVPWKPVPELTASPSSASGSQCTETFSRGSSRTQGKNFFASIPPLPVALAMLLIVVGGAWMFSLDGKDDPAPVKGAAPETPSPAATARPAPDRERMVYIPPGPAWLGASEARLRSHAQGLASLTGNPQAVDDFVEACLREPAQTVSLKGFWIDKYEVTNAQYARFVKATGHAPPSYWQGSSPPPGREDYPVTNVLYRDAEAYAAWVGKRLPTVAQWARAFRGFDDRMYPWGNDWRPDRANVSENTAFPGVSAVTASPLDATTMGVFNMVGNVSEIVRDRTSVGGVPTTIMKGSNSLSNGDLWGAAPFQIYLIGDDVTGDLVGFRCVLEDDK